jgi:hypothetical protein
MRLGIKSRREIFEARYRRYQRAGKKDKGKILDEMAGTTGLNRGHLAHAIHSPHITKMRNFGNVQLFYKTFSIPSYRAIESRYVVFSLFCTPDGRHACGFILLTWAHFLRPQFGTAAKNRALRLYLLPNTP